MSRPEGKDQSIYYYFIGDSWEDAFAILFVVTGVGSNPAIFIVGLQDNSIGIR